MDTIELLRQDIEELANPDNVRGTAADMKEIIPFGDELPNNMINIAADTHFEFTTDQYVDDTQQVSSPTIEGDEGYVAVDLYRHVINGIELFAFDYEEGESLFIHQVNLPSLIEYLRSLLPEDK